MPFPLLSALKPLGCTVNRKKNDGKLLKTNILQKAKKLNGIERRQLIVTVFVQI